MNMDEGSNKLFIKAGARLNLGREIWSAEFWLSNKLRFNEWTHSESLKFIYEGAIEN